MSTKTGLRQGRGRNPLPEAFEEFLGRIKTGQATPFATLGGVKYFKLIEMKKNGVSYLVISGSPEPARRNGFNLSSREWEIVRLVAKGLPNKCIADVLNISEWTVATHLRRIFMKLGVSRREALIAEILGRFPE